jgi:LuxR family maltose regulon positive regulatory protein
MVQFPQNPPGEYIMTTLINEIFETRKDFVLVLDDYHVIEDPKIDEALVFLLDNLPMNMHLIMTSREDPQLPLARLRARNQLGELRVGDLRFSQLEVAEFLNEIMHLQVSKEDISVLDSRTEGWIAGLQLAAISMQAYSDRSDFIQSFSGSHHFVMDFLVEEVLNFQSEKIQEFLLKTSILDRMSGPLCDAILSDPNIIGQEILEYLYQVNLFIIPLDNERRWYRYHHLFLDLLRQRLMEKHGKENENDVPVIQVLHKRASQWFEQNGFFIEAFQHAVESNDIGLTEKLLAGNGMPLQYRGVMMPVANWLGSLSEETMNARPLLWVTYASTLTMMGKPVDNIESILQFAEKRLGELEENAVMRDAIGQIAAIRAMMAIPQNQMDTVVREAKRAMNYLHPDNLSVRTNLSWILGYVQQVQGSLDEAEKAFHQALSVSQTSKNIVMSVATTIGLGQISECKNLLNQANRYYEEVIRLAGEPPLPYACEAFVGFARIAYEHNDLEAVEPNAQLSLQLARQIPNVNTPISIHLALAPLHMARGEFVKADEVISNAEMFAEQNNFPQRLPEIATYRIDLLLKNGELIQANSLAETFNLPVSQAKIKIVQGNYHEALTIIQSHRKNAETNEEQRAVLEALVVESLCHFFLKDYQKASAVLEQALQKAKAGEFVRLFLDKGENMHKLLSDTSVEPQLLTYRARLLSEFEHEALDKGKTKGSVSSEELIEPLSEREVEILGLIAQGYSNQEISKNLFLALNTVKGHNRNLFGKLGVKNRTEAVLRARQLGIL